MRNKEYIDHAIVNGYEMEISQYFSKGWNLFKLNAGGFIGFLFVYGIILSIINLIPFLGFIINIIISPALTLGWAIMSNKLSNDQGNDFGFFFKGFDKLSELIVAAIIQFVITLVIALPMILILIFTVGASALLSATMGMDANFGIGGILGLFVFGLILAYVTLCMRWTYQLIYFHDYKAMDAITTSFKLVNKRPLQHLGLVVLYFLTGVGGMLALIVGLIIAVPFIYCTDYCAFEDVTGMKLDGEENFDITDNLI